MFHQNTYDTFWRGESYGGWLSYNFWVLERDGFYKRPRVFRKIFLRGIHKKILLYERPCLDKRQWVNERPQVNSLFHLSQTTMYCMIVPSNIVLSGGGLYEVGLSAIVQYFLERRTLGHGTLSLSIVQYP